MSVTYGFYNSLGGDRAYTARQMSEMFEGVLDDGVFATVGDALAVSAYSDMSIKVGAGRAWFNNTWTKNDSDLILALSASDLVLNRIDMVVLEVNTDAGIRSNAIKILTGVNASSPTPPVLASGELLNQYPLAQIYIPAGATVIPQENITNKIGTAACPFVTGVIDTINVDVLLAQWDAEFDTWFSNMQAILDSSAEGNILALIQANTDAFDGHVGTSDIHVKITRGTADPVGGLDGDIYVQYE